MGALFIPTLALALGTWTGGSTAEALSLRMPLVYLLLTVLLMALAVLGRRRQLQM